MTAIAGPPMDAAPPDADPGEAGCARDVRYGVTRDPEQFTIVFELDAELPSGLLAATLYDSSGMTLTSVFRRIGQIMPDADPGGDTEDASSTTDAEPAEDANGDAS